jgi:hypothetical protein
MLQLKSQTLEQPACNPVLGLLALRLSTSQSSSEALTLSHTLPYTLICSKLFKILPQSIPNSPTPLLFFCSSFALQKQHGNVDLSKECRGRGANEETGQQCPLWPGKKRPATSPKSGRSSWHTAPLINIAQEIHRDRLQEHQNYLEDTRSN